MARSADIGGSFLFFFPSPYTRLILYTRSSPGSVQSFTRRRPNPRKNMVQYYYVVVYTYTRTQYDLIEEKKTTNRCVSLYIVHRMYACSNLWYLHNIKVSHIERQCIRIFYHVHIISYTSNTVSGARGITIAI